MRLQAAPRNNKGERRPTDLELYNGLWLGQTVLGRVVVSTRKGARVEILEAHNTPTDNLRHRHGCAERLECLGGATRLMPAAWGRCMEVGSSGRGFAAVQHVSN